MRLNISKILKWYISQ